MLIANTIVNHIFPLLVDVTESCFWITTYLILRWKCKKWSFVHILILLWLKQVIYVCAHTQATRSEFVCVRESEWVRKRERDYNSIMKMKNHITTWIGAYNWMWLSLINQLFTEQCIKWATKRKCVNWSIKFYFLLIVQNYTTSILDPTRLLVLKFSSLSSSWIISSITTK